MRKLRLSDDSSSYSPGASSDAESVHASQLPSAERPPLGASRFATLKAQAGLGGASSAELGALEEGEETMQAHEAAAAANGTAHLADESALVSKGAAPRDPDGNGAAASGPVDAEGLPEIEEPTSWHGQDAVSISLATLELLGDWLAHAPSPSR